MAPGRCGSRPGVPGSLVSVLVRGRRPRPEVQYGQLHPRFAGLGAGEPQDQFRRVRRAVRPASRGDGVLGVLDGGIERAIERASVAIGECRIRGTGRDRIGCRIIPVSPGSAASRLRQQVDKVDKVDKDRA